MLIHEAVSEALHLRAGIRRAGWPAGRKLVLEKQKTLSGTYFLCIENHRVVMHSSRGPMIFYPCAEELSANDWMLAVE